MKDERCIHFLQWALPELRMRWAGFRKVRRQVCKRIDRRIRELGLERIEDYRSWLREHTDEWAYLDAMCRITVSRFYRDRAVFDTLAAQVLPALAAAACQRGEHVLRIWSAGCGAGEEPYTLALLWQFELRSRFPELQLDILATDADVNMLRRARAGRYTYGSLKELPARLRERAFTRSDDTYCLEPEYRQGIRFMAQDVRKEQPEGPFNLVLCRNLVFTYLDVDRQCEFLKRVVGEMHDGAALLLGKHERTPDTTHELTAWFEKQGIYRRVGIAEATCG